MGKDYRYIIMAGGTFPKFTETPRQLLRFRSEPLVVRTIRMLRQLEIEDIAISSNDPRFEGLGVPVLHHENGYKSWDYNVCEGTWCDAFYPTDEPTCYLHGDVVFSPEAIRTIVEADTDDIIFFGSAPPFPREYPKLWIEPFGWKVRNQKHLRQAVEDVKRLEREGRFNRRPISWEVWNVISRGPDGDPNPIDYSSYVHINDWTTDIDKPEEIGLLERLASME